MIRRYLLDTNIVSYLVTGRSPAARARLAALNSGEVACISSITEGELRYGLAKSPKPEMQSSTEWFLARLQILPWHSEEANVYGRIRAQQEKLGKTLQSIDMLIAAHAIAAGATLVTRDKAFQHVEGLHGIENWANDM